MNPSHQTTMQKGVRSRRHGECRTVRVLAGCMEWKLTAEETGGHYCVLETFVRPVLVFLRISMWIKRRSTSWRARWRSPSLALLAWSGIPSQQATLSTCPAMKYMDFETQAQRRRDFL
jgi:hypothetical protein